MTGSASKLPLKFRIVCPDPRPPQARWTDSVQDASPGNEIRSFAFKLAGHQFFCSTLLHWKPVGLSDSEFCTGLHIGVTVSESEYIKIFEARGTQSSSLSMTYFLRSELIVAVFS
jgi:hypothetical protein